MIVTLLLKDEKKSHFVFQHLVMATNKDVIKVYYLFIDNVVNVQDWSSLSVANWLQVV